MGVTSWEIVPVKVPGSLYSAKLTCSEIPSDWGHSVVEVTAVVKAFFAHNLQNTVAGVDPLGAEIRRAERHAAGR